MSSGQGLKQNPDVGGSYHHFTGNFFTLPGWCGSIVTIDCNTACGIHYHSNGEGNGNNFMGFTKRLFDFLMSSKPPQLTA
jgi:hypothetical protein